MRLRQVGRPRHQAERSSLAELSGHYGVNEELRSVLSVFISRPACSSSISAPPPTFSCLLLWEDSWDSAIQRAKTPFTLPDRQTPPHPPTRPTHSFSGLHSGDHQHSHTTIFSQGASHFWPPPTTWCLVESLRRGGARGELYSHTVFIVAHSYYIFLVLMMKWLCV